MKKITALLFAVIFCVIGASCDSKITINEAYTTDVVRTLIQEYGNYVYTDFGKTFRYNRKTNEFAPACTDPECNGDCPLDNAVTSVNQIVDGKLYFYSFEAYTHNVFYAYQDIATGEIGVIKSLSAVENSGGSFAFVYDGYLYYCRKVLKDGGDPAKSSDYLSCYCRISVKGSEDEVIMPCEDNGAIVMVAGGKIITMNGSGLLAIDIYTKEINNLFNFEDNSFISLGSRISYLNGKMYFLVRSKTYITSEYQKSSNSLNFLLSVDINTGEFQRVVDEPVVTFCLTDAKIYYSPFKLRHMYIPEDYDEHPENVVIFLADETLYACDIDGSNNKAVYTNAEIDYIESYTVIDGVLYGWLCDYNKDINAFEPKMYFGSIDFLSKKVLRAEVNE